LRGALVKGKIEFDPRRTLRNYKKLLPSNNALARAVGLEKTQKGARLIIESDLANELLMELQDWTTNEGYVRNMNQNIPSNDILRRICPTPDQNTYELLYFWETDESSANIEIWTTENNVRFEYATKKAELKHIASMLTKNLSSHYKETINLIDRCKKRDTLTEYFFQN